jgi:hypothetical protein
MSADPRITELESEGYVVLRAKSYRDAQERHRVSEALRHHAEERADEYLKWGQDFAAKERVAWDRCAFLYGEAMKRGATHDELRQPEHPIASMRPSLVGASGESGSETE